MEKTLQIVAGKFKGKKLFAPAEDITRPNIERARSALFNIIRSKYAEKLPFSSVVDAFAGSASFAFECISQGMAEEVVAIEKDFEAFKVIKKNLHLFPEDLPELSLVRADILDVIEKVCAKAELIYLDPPYSSPVLGQVLNKVAKFGRQDLSLIVLADFKKDAGNSVRDMLEKKFVIDDERVYGRNMFFFCTMKTA